ncbi:MAG TPA: ISL3 family transposase [Candidatus Kapabacteria bacterium]|nr:ISL3 family transposase [Candidatus Kapabacteria bacterium]
MDEKGLYTRFLGIGSPGCVKGVTLDESSGEVHVSVEYRGDRVCACPKCGKQVPRYDKRHRTWRHLDSCQYKTIVSAAVPRVNCDEHGVLQIPVPWADPGSGLTAMLEAAAIDLLKDASTTAVARRLRLSWDAVDGIIARAVARGLSRRSMTASEHISVDETSFQKRHEYVTVVADASSGAVLQVTDARSEESLKAYYEQLSDDEGEGILSVSMDMWDAYIKATSEHVPDAKHKICFDKFHVVSYLGTAVDETRRAEHRQLKSEGDKRLARTRSWWLRNPHTMSAEQWSMFDQLRTATLKTSAAGGFKELAMDLWHYVHPTWATKAWNRWIALAEASELPAVPKVARTIKHYLWGIINAIVLTRTNAIAESINSRIQKIKARACGFRSRDRFRNAIYFHCGKLDLYPHSYRPFSTHTVN